MGLLHLYQLFGLQHLSGSGEARGVDIGGTAAANFHLQTTQPQLA